MTMGWVFDLPGARTTSSKIEQPFRQLVSIEFDPSLAVKFAVETSCQSAESESNSKPGLRSHMPLMRGLLPTAISAAHQGHVATQPRLGIRLALGTLARSLHGE